MHVAQGFVHNWHVVDILQAHDPEVRVICTSQQDKQVDADEQFKQGNEQAVQT